MSDSLETKKNWRTSLFSWMWTFEPDAENDDGDDDDGDDDDNDDDDGDENGGGVIPFFEADRRWQKQKIKMHKNMMKFWLSNSYNSF